MIVDASAYRRHDHAAPCRFCSRPTQPFIDLGMSPLCETFLTKDELTTGELFYPLDVKICDYCWLAQLQEYVSPKHIFFEYAYFSSYSQAWLKHASDYVEGMIARLGLTQASFVLEIASNDGYLLQNMVAAGIPCLGIEPAANVAKAAEAAGVPTRVAFFDEQLAQHLVSGGLRADLIVANNVLAQVPQLNDFVAGLRVALKPGGVITLEFPHLLRLIQGNQFDTIYHEHFSYFSLYSIERILAAHELRAYDVQELWTHGGSLRVFCCHAANSEPESAVLAPLRAAERAAGLGELTSYRAFGRRVQNSRIALLQLLTRLKHDGAVIAGYGAPGKGNTLLNYCGISTELLDFTVDRNPYKHGRFLPGSHIPVLPTVAIDEAQPDYVLILPWNLKTEIIAQIGHIRDWGGRFIVPIPDPLILE